MQAPVQVVGGGALGGVGGAKTGTCSWEDRFQLTTSGWPFPSHQCRRGRPFDGPRISALDNGCRTQGSRTNSLPLLAVAKPVNTSLMVSQFFSFFMLASQRCTFG